MRILIAYGSKGKFFHMKEFSDALAKLGIECRLVKDSDYSKGFPSKNLNDWFSGNKEFKKRRSLWGKGLYGSFNRQYVSG